MNAGEQIRWRLSSFAEVDYLMPISQRLQIRITGPSIRHHGTAGLNRCLDKRVQTGRRGIRDLFHAHSTNFGPILLGSNNNQCLILDLSAPQPLFKTAEIGFVHFDRAPEAISARPNHRTPQFMKPRPCRFITPQPENPLQTQRACTALLAGNPPDRPEPKEQGHPAPLKNSTAGNRSLITACSALNKSRSNRPPFASLTSRAAKPVRPAQFQQISAASFFCRKLGFKFHKVLGVVFHTPLFYISGLPESRGYPHPGITSLRLAIPERLPPPLWI